MRRNLWMAVFVFSLVTPLFADAPNVYGIHFWDAGANHDIMGNKMGWDVEFYYMGYYPDPTILNRIRGEGFSIILRLDYRPGETVPQDPADHPGFAAWCAEVANIAKDYARIYVIGNEMEISGAGSSSNYAACFQLVRDAIKAVQPEAWVCIGAACGKPYFTGIVKRLGPDGFDGAAAHSNSVCEGFMNVMDDYNVPKWAGIWVTEFGWVLGTNPDPYSEFYRIFHDIEVWNKSHERQQYSQCFFVYWNVAWQHASLKTHELENQAYEQALLDTDACNRFRLLQIYITDFQREVLSNGNVRFTWRTNVPSTSQVHWLVDGTSIGSSNQLDTNLVENHEMTVSGLSQYKKLKVWVRSCATNFGDASYGPVEIQAGLTRSPECWLKEGWNLISIPIHPEDPSVDVSLKDLIDAGNVLAGSMFSYSPATGYTGYPTDFTAIQIGRGYWVYLTHPVGTKVVGLKQWYPYEIPLEQGWNLIGHPFDRDVYWYKATVKRGTQSLSVADAEAAGWIHSTLYFYDDGYKTLKVDSSGDDQYLRPWRGYWLLAFEDDLTLVIPRY